MATPDWNQWLGRTVQVDDVVTMAPLRLMAATLDRSAEGIATQPLRPLWHWLYFLPGEQQSNIGADGHPRRGGFLPPVDLPRRMWAGGRLQFLKPILPGAQIRRVSRIESIDSKEGRTGSLVFVKVVHEISDAQGLAIREEHDIVYRDVPSPDAPQASAQAAPTDEQFSRRIDPDPVLLFRYSALTFNGHRIHYDRSYVTQEEGYPGLIVHGPLIATLLLEQLQLAHPAARVASFEFKAVSPLFDIAPFTVCGRLDGTAARLWARGPEGQLAMQATAQLA
jgi:3-methylfumaryl-CoA hydratase